MDWNDLQRRLHRFRAFTEYLTKEFEHLRALFEGKPYTRTVDQQAAGSVS